MIPGRQYKPEDLLAILRRRYWLLVLPAAVLMAVAALIARILPDRYSSEAVVLVVPQQVAQNLVRTTVTTNLATRLQAISQQILSRTRLERIIQDHNLYPEERQTGLVEDLVTKVRNDIKVAPMRGDAFRVSFEGPNPRAVQAVAASVASLFIDESLRDRTLLAEGTDQFLEVQLDDARRRLQEQEKALEAYRVRYQGQLPTQLSGNLQALSGAQMQIQASLESINRDRDQQLMLQRQLADLTNEDYVEPATAAAPPAPAAPQVSSLEEISGPTAQQLAAARSLLTQLELRYKPDYPDIPRTRRLIQDLERKLDAEALGRPVSSASAPAVNPREEARQKRIAELRSQLEQLERRITASQANEARVRGLASEYQQKIDQIPARESELTELTRDYGTLQDTYTSLLRRKEESNLAANLERRQIGEQFKLLDEAQLPERPSSPNRPLLTALGLVAGLAFGAALIVLLEFRDTSFSTDEEVSRLLSLPVLAVVPMMHSEVDRRRETRRRVFLGLGMGSTVAGCVALVVYTFVR